MPTLLKQLLEIAVFLEDQGMNPGEIVQRLQISQIALLKTPQRFLGRVLAKSTALIQLPEARPRLNHVVRIGHEKMIEQKEGIRFAQIFGGNSRNIKEKIGRPFLRVGENLHQQA